MTVGGGDPALGSILQEGITEAGGYVNVTSDDKLLFVSNEYDGAIAVIDLERARRTGYGNGSIMGSIPAGVRPFALTFSPDSRWLYATVEAAAPEWGWPAECTREASGKPELVDPQGAILVIDVRRAAANPSAAVLARVPAACAPVRAALSPDGNLLYVAARNSNAVVLFDAAKLVSDGAHARIGLAPVGQSPTPLALIDGGTKLLVGNTARYDQRNPPGTLMVLDAAKLDSGADAILGVVPTGVFPREMRVSADQGTVFLTNWKSGFLQVIDAKSLPRAPSP